ncbi:unnamed protein product [Allacma fusca]|uniref:Osteopetrosis-associated transmembrane protein 1 n=1 Tax=Allacma fusca TaxID=39272 RepID=A0A8J2KVI3_9HEXA|nr:unnamed protein product [Allacma fusca]
MRPQKYSVSSCFIFLVIIDFHKFLPTAEASIEQEIHLDSFDITTPSPICQDAASLFGSAVSDFSSCSVRNARPINLCQGCVLEFLTVLKTYEDISDTYSADNISCILYFTNLDQLEVLKLNLEFVKYLWNRGHCDNCFARDGNGTITGAILSDISRYNQCYQLTSGCLSRHSQSNTTCTECRMGYNELNVLYSHLEEKYGQKLCFDVVDTMNRTRENWSYNFNCYPIRKSEFWVYFLMICMGIIPISFYLLALLLSNVQEATVVQLRRMGDTIDRSNGAHHIVSPLNQQSGEPSVELIE